MPIIVPPPCLPSSAPLLTISLQYPPSTLRARAHSSGGWCGSSIVLSWFAISMLSTLSLSLHPCSTPQAVAHGAGGRWCVIPRPSSLSALLSLLEGVSQWWLGVGCFMSVPIIFRVGVLAWAISCWLLSLVVVQTLKIQERTKKTYLGPKRHSRHSPSLPSSVIPPSCHLPLSLSLLSPSAYVVVVVWC
jgi:hypothetical protein